MSRLLQSRRRPLNTMEREVLETALKLEESDVNGKQWNGVTIQKAAWPEWKSYIAKRSGISAAIQTLKHRGLAVSNGYWFHLTRLGKVVAEQSRGEAQKI